LWIYIVISLFIIELFQAHVLFWHILLMYSIIVLIVILFYCRLSDSFALASFHIKFTKMNAYSSSLIVMLTKIFSREGLNKYNKMLSTYFKFFLRHKLNWEIYCYFVFLFWTPNNCFFEMIFYIDFLIMIDAPKFWATLCEFLNSHDILT
jgi:hypothetical protein